tara:strand:+ start:561 stop:770 length:210 start_codon:yes stop_codon:yes gene_type:complete
MKQLVQIWILLRESWNPLVTARTVDTVKVLDKPWGTVYACHVGIMVARLKGSIVDAIGMPVMLARMSRS